MKTKTCIICKDDFEGFGNNPYPLSNEGFCCNPCNSKVISARLKLLHQAAKK